MTTVQDLRQAVTVLGSRLGLQTELHRSSPGDGSTRYALRVRAGKGWQDYPIGVGKREAGVWLAGADRALDLADRAPAQGNPKRGAVRVPAHRRRRPRVHRNPDHEQRLIRDVAAELASIEIPRGEEELEVRLQLLGSELSEDGELENDPEWSVWTGASDYDTDHRGDWGAGTLTEDTDANELAKELVEEALESAAS